MGEGIRCTASWDGVRCRRTATEFYSLDEPPYYEALCRHCSARSSPHGRAKAGEITEEEAVVRSVMECGRGARGQ